MGLKIHTLASLPEDVARSFFIYLLDYGWKEPLSQVLDQNFDRLAEFAARHGGLVLRGFDGAEFSSEVLSWHHINGEDGDIILPAILITTMHPQKFKSMNKFSVARQGKTLRPSAWEDHDRMIFIPLRDTCQSATDVTDLIDRCVRDLRMGRSLSGFLIDREMKAGQGTALVDALVLKPSIAGFGVDLKLIIRFLRTGFDNWRQRRRRGDR